MREPWGKSKVRIRQSAGHHCEALKYSNWFEVCVNIQGSRLKHEYWWEGVELDRWEEWVIMKPGGEENLSKAATFPESWHCMRRLIGDRTSFTQGPMKVCSSPLAHLFYIPKLFKHQSGLFLYNSHMISKDFQTFKDQIMLPCFVVKDVSCFLQ